MDRRELTQEESQAILVAIIKETAKLWLMRGIKIGFLGGLAVG
jgi:hypothetical protein